MSTRRVSLAAITGVLDRWLLAFVLLAAAAGLTAPGPGRLLDTHAGIPAVLAVLVLAAGANLETPRLPRLRSTLAPIAIITAVSTLALPALAWLASRLVTTATLRDGVLAAGLAPAEVAAIALAARSGSDTALTATLLLTSTTATIALTGPLLSLLAGTAAGVDTAELVTTLMLVVALPLAVGIAARARWPHATPIRAAAPVLGNVALLVLVYLVAAQIPHEVAYLPVIPALLAYLAGAAGLGWALARLVKPAQRHSVLLPIAMRDFAVAAGIADTAFGHAAAAPLGVYGILVLIFGTLTGPATTGCNGR